MIEYRRPGFCFVFTDKYLSCCLATEYIMSIEEHFFKPNSCMLMFFCLLFSSTMADVAPKFAVNQSRPEEITIKEDVGHINFITEDGFGKIINLACRLISF